MIRARLLLPAVMLLALLGGGCQQALFTDKDTTRSPFERYWALHGRQAMVAEKDQYGNDKPMLRERLRPSD